MTPGKNMALTEEVFFSRDVLNVYENPIQSCAVYLPVFINLPLFPSENFINLNRSLEKA